MKFIYGLNIFYSYFKKKNIFWFIKIFFILLLYNDKDLDNLI